MITLLSDDMLDFLLQINHIPVETTDNYNSKVEKLKSADIIPGDEEYYSNKSEIPENNITQISDSSPSIQQFFKDGDYTYIGAGIPTCIFPNGSTYDGKVKISSTFQCNDISQSFLQKNIIKKTIPNINITKIQVISFNINTKCINVNNVGSSLQGKYTINGNKLYVDFDESFMSGLGINVKMIYSYEKTPAGFVQITYYLDTATNNYNPLFIHLYTLELK